MPGAWDAQSVKSEQASPAVWDSRPVKRRRSDQDNQSSSDGEGFTHQRIKISDRDELLRWYEQSFKDLQQVNCKSVAKVWIKAIEEKKQINHPYNGGKQFNGDSEASKPPWWPRDVQHKEPDHLRKPCERRLIRTSNRQLLTPLAGRVALLLHILTELSDVVKWGQYHASADKLGASLSTLSNNKNLQAKGGWDIIKEVLRIREQQERWEDGQLGELHVAF